MRAAYWHEAALAGITGSCRALLILIRHVALLLIVQGVTVTVGMRGRRWFGGRALRRGVGVIITTAIRTEKEGRI